MKCRKLLVVPLLALSLSFLSLEGDSPEDVIVLFDMSRDSLAWFSESREFLAGAFLEDFVRPSDTFHLISFADSARLEISRRVSFKEDRRTVAARILLLYPFYDTTDEGAALTYAEKFAASLPELRKKRIVLFTPKTNIDAAAIQSRFGSAAVFYLATIPASIGNLSAARTGKAVPPAAPQVVKVAPPAVPKGEIIIDLTPQSDALAAPVIETKEVVPIVDDIVIVERENAAWGGRALFFFVIAALAGLLVFVIVDIAVKRYKEAQKRITENSRLENYIYETAQSIQNGYDIPPHRGLLQRAIYVRAGNR